MDEYISHPRARIFLILLTLSLFRFLFSLVHVDAMGSPFPPCIFTFHSFLLNCIAILPSFPVSNANLPLSVCPCVQPPKQHTSRLAHVIVEMPMGWDSLCMSRWRRCILGPTHRSCEFLLIRLTLSSPLSLMFVNSVPSHFSRHLFQVWGQPSRFPTFLL